jgi:fucose permease
LNNGFLIATLGERSFLLSGLALLGVSMGMLGLMPPFLVVLFLFLPIGFGIAILDAGLNSYIAKFPRNASIFNYLHAFYGGGALLGPFLASLLLSLNFGWNSVYIFWCGISVLLFVSIILAFSSSTSGKQQQATAPEVPGREGQLRAAIRLRIVWLIAIFLFFYVGIEHSIGNWSYSFLTEQRHIQPLFSGWIVSGHWLGLTLGRIALAPIAQRLGEKRVIQLCLFGSFGSMILVWLSPFPTLSAFGLFLIGFSLGPIFPTTIALTSRFLPGRFLPSAIGFLTSLTSIGAAFFPWLVGYLAQHSSLNILFPYVLLLTLAMFGFWMVLRRRSATP